MPWRSTSAACETTRWPSATAFRSPASSGRWWTSPAVVPPDQLERALREAEARRLGELESLDAVLARHPRRRGTAKSRSVLAAGHPGDGVTRSELEDRFLAFLDSAGLPRPEVSAHLESGGHLVECDYLWRTERLIVELDGHATDGRRSAFERPRSRPALSAAGWRVVRITWRQLEREAAAVAADLRMLFA